MKTIQHRGYFIDKVKVQLIELIFKMRKFANIHEKREDGVLHTIVSRIDTKNYRECLEEYIAILTIFLTIPTLPASSKQQGMDIIQTARKFLHTY